jgi:hypothetical protein
MPLGNMKRMTDPCGITVEYNEDGSVIEVLYWFECCHCQGGWFTKKRELGGTGSGGFCGKCMGYY